MTLIVVYAILVAIGQTFAFVIGMLVDMISQAAGLAVFLCLYFTVFVVGWKMAVHLTAPGGFIEARLNR